MSDQAPWEDYGDTPAPAPAPRGLAVNVTDDSAPAPEAPKNEAPKDHIAALLGAGASKGDIERYARGQGIDPSRIVGLEDAVKFRDDPANAGAAPSSVTLYSDPAPVAPKPDTLSGLTPDQVEQRFANLPDSMKPGIGDAVSHGIFAGLDNEAASLLAGAGNAIAHPVDAYNSGGQTVADAYHDQRTTGLARVDYGNQHSPILAPTAGFLGALINPIGATARGVTGAMKVAGAYGLVSGFEDNNGSLLDRGQSALTTGAISALAAPVIGAGIKGIASGANRASGGRLAAMVEGRAAQGTNESMFARSGQAPIPVDSPSNGAQVLDAAERLSRNGVSIQPNAPMVGGKTTRMAAMGSDQTVLGHAQIGRSMERVSVGVEAANANAAGEAGGIAGGQTLDQAAAKVADPSRSGSLANYEARSGAEGDRLYEDAYARGGEHIELDTPATIARLDSEITRMQQNPNPPVGMANLIELRQTLASGTWTPRGLRDLRTGFGDKLEVADRTTREAAKRLWGPLSEDIQNGFRNVGKDDAANAFAQADRFYNDRATNLEDIVPHVLGSDLSAEKVADRLVGLSRSDGVRLSRALDLMSPDQAGEVRGALIGNLGLARNGVQNSTNDAFSPAEWATNWSKVSDPAKRVFRGQVSTDLNDLATVIGGVKDSGRMRNSSNTAGAHNVIHILHSLGRFAGGAAAAATGGVGGFVAGSAGSAILGKVMSSPGVARALVGLSNGRSTHWLAARMGGIAARSSVPVAEALRDMIAVALDPAKQPVGETITATGGNTAPTSTGNDAAPWEDYSQSIAPTAPTVLPYSEEPFVDPNTADDPQE